MFKKLLGKKKAKHYEQPPNGPDWLYSLEWTKRKQPSPGAMQYSFDTLALPPVSPISGAIAVRAPIIKPVNTAPQPYVTKHGIVIGIPTISGGIVGQPLYNPDAGYVGPSFMQNNNANPRQTIAPAGRAM